MPHKDSHTKPSLSTQAFWDIDLRTLDFDQFADFTIIRVFERGSMNDLKEILSYYGKEQILKSLKTAKTLLPRAITIAEKYLHISPKELKCSANSPQAGNYSRY